jgi:CRP-like cAMP-binding protein
MKTMTELVRAHPFLAGLDAAFISTVAGCARNRVFADGAYLMREGQPADEFHLIRHGTVSVEVYAPRGGPHVLQTLGPGEFVGVSWIVPPYIASSDARATGQVRSFGFDAVCLRRKCEAEPGLGYAMMKLFVPALVQRMSAARMQALDLFGERM